MMQARGYRLAIAFVEGIPFDGDLKEVAAARQSTQHFLIAVKLSLFLKMVSG